MGNYFRAGQGKTVGNQRVYRRKNCQPYITKYQALSIPVWEIERWTQRVKQVLIYDEFHQIRYIVDAKHFRDAEPRDTDWGEQLFVSIDNFEMLFERP